MTNRFGNIASRIGWAVVVGAAFGFVEAAVVIYLRALVYPEGFRFPLRPFAPELITVEVVREIATVLLLFGTAMLAGRNRWGRVGAFLLLFGVWDITYYMWLRLAINWPTSLLDWDILFLLPLPWIGPVIAPVLVACVMVGAGIWFMLSEERTPSLRATLLTFVLSFVGTAILLFSFMRDTEATLRSALPSPYAYSLLAAGIACYAGALLTIKRSHAPSPS
jgi:hypothetical protein